MTWRAATAAVAGLALLAACTGTSDSPEDPAGSPPGPVATADTAAGTGGFAASLSQYRTDTGTRQVIVRLTSRHADPVQVNAIRLVSPGLTGLPATAKGTTFVEGQTIDLTTRYGRPRCGRPLSTAGDPVGVELTVRQDGSTTTERVPVDGAGVDFLGRLVIAECALAEVRRTVEIGYAGSFRFAPGSEGLTLQGGIRFTRPPGSVPGDPVTVPQLGGSVLLAFRPAVPTPSDRPLLRMGPRQRAALLPVELSSNGRCDAHARLESKRTFILTVYVRRPGVPLQPIVLKPDRQSQLRGLEAIDKACAAG